MSLKGKWRKSIAFRSVAVIVVILSVFCIVVGTIAYRNFAGALFNQYKTGAFRIANAAASAVDADSLDEYLEKKEDSEAYRTVRERLDQLCNASSAAFIYVIRPDLTDYGHITFILSVMNQNADFELYEPGYVRKTTNDEYREKYKALYAGESDRELLILNGKGYNKETQHITAMVPLRGADGQTKGILCVQRQMRDMSVVRRKFMKNVLEVLAVLLLIVIIIQGLFFSRTMIHPIRIIAEEAGRFARENVTIGEKLTDKIRGSDEIGQLAASVDQMEEQVASYVQNLTKVTAEQERIGAELDIARRIQSSMLPGVFPPFPDRTEFDIYASMNPAREVGGDFYDFFLVDEDHLALVMADVSGKGVPAALFMAIAKKLIKNHVLAGESPSEVFCNVNNQLCDGNNYEMFVTAWLGILRLSDGMVTAANAGHEHPAVRSRGGLYELQKYKHSLVLAAMENVTYKEHTFMLSPGDSLFVYTDGVPEAKSGSDELFGTDRMLEALNRSPDADPESLITSVRDTISLFTGDAPMFDDMTMLSLCYHGPSAEIRDGQ